MATQPQRIVRAPCPACGAPVEFRSAQSTHAVCSYCQSTVVRDGETLSRIGKVGELFDDHTPLQLLATGRFKGKGFTLVGRLQYKSASGSWTEWIAAFEGDDSRGTLAEDNGAYVFALPGQAKRELPPASAFRIGATTAIAGKSFQVASVDEVALVSAQGELPKLPPATAFFHMVELRSADGEVLSIDYGASPPEITRGRAVLLEELQLAGLKDENARETKGRQFACPHCGAPVQAQFGASKSITCASCDALIDLNGGVGGELRAAEQDEPVQPLIPLGSLGTLQGAQWQVVGYQHRLGWEPGDEDDRFGWDEYLLYNRQRGFIFLVDAVDGWSVVKPVTGAPEMASSGTKAKYLGQSYSQVAAYFAETTYVRGEFYWPVRRGQKTFNRDFMHGKSLLNMEEAPGERTWSSGGIIDSDAVARAFKLEGKKDLLKRADAGPTTSKQGLGCATLFAILFVILVLLFVIRACTSSSCDPAREDCSRSSSGWRSSGGSYGGSSGGGGHK